MILSRKEGTEYLVGLDLQQGFCQVSMLHEKAARGGIYGSARSDPETLSLKDDQNGDVPMAVCRDTRGTWLFGREALTAAQVQGLPLGTDLLECCREGRQMLLGAESLDPVPVLSAFLDYVLALFSDRIPREKTGMLVCTVPVLTPEMTEALHRAFGSLSMPGAGFRCLTHTDAFYYYILMQSRERQPGDSVLCDLSREGRLTVSTLYFPDRRDSSRYEVSTGSWNLAASDPPSRKDQILFQAFRDMTMLPGVKGTFKTVFLAGDAFLGRWMQQSLRYIGQGRKVYQGNNLYSKGAALCALYTLEQEDRGSSLLIREKLPEKDIVPENNPEKISESISEKKPEKKTETAKEDKAQETVQPQQESLQGELPEQSSAEQGKEDLLSAGRAYARQFRYKKAAQCFQKVFRETGDPEAGILLMAALRMGVPEDAYSAYVQRHPELYLASKEAEKRIQEADSSYRNGSEARMIRKMRQLKREERTGELDALVSYRLTEAVQQFRSDS